ncbi:MAG: hypothetical protein ACTHLO_04650 [Pseudolabrys sp.]
MTSTFEQAKVGRGISARLRRFGRTLRSIGAAYMRGLQEQRRREAALILAHQRYVDSLDRAARFDADARPKIVPLRSAPATQPAQDCGSI